MELTGTIPSQIRALPLAQLYLSNNPLCYSVNYGSWVTNSDYSASFDCENCGVTCENGGICYSGILTLSCSCSVYYTGTLCQFDQNTCRSSPCQNGGGCVNGIGGFTCACSGTGYGGTLCNVPDAANDACSAGFSKNSNGTCDSCVEGTLSLAGAACIPCQKGTASNVTGATTYCPPCQAGYFASSMNSTSCSACSPSSNCQVGSLASTLAYSPVPQM